MTRSKNRRKRDTGHKEAETCFVVKESSIFGRFLEANKDLKAGELILNEEPLVVGPSQDSEKICIGCYQPMAYDLSWRCDSCGFPLCSQTCPGKKSKTGHGQECWILSKSLVNKKSVLDLGKNMEAITPLRCLALKQTNPELWEIFSKMESHTETRKKIQSIWKTNQEKVVNVIQSDWGLKEFDQEIIHQVCGVLEVNAFEVGPSLRAVYPTAYLFAHNCIPNTKHSDGKNFEIFFRTTVPVKKKSALFATYTYILQGTHKRRRHLKDSKFFDCSCERCKDPSECGTNISALKCPLCVNGLVLSVDPLDSDANWTCVSKKCPGYVIPSKNVESLINKLYTELDIIDGNNVTGYEKFLKNNSRVLSENHYLNLSAQHCLYQLYGKIDGFLINDLTEEQLNRKIDLCKNLLRSFAKLEPGLSKQRGIILYELHAPLMILLQRWYAEKRHGKLILKKMLNDVYKSLEEAKLILQVEPEGSSELEISHAADQALQSLSGWALAVNHS